VHQPGTAPGTIPEPSGPPQPTRLRLARFDADVLQEVDLLEPEGIDQCDECRLTWLDVEGQDIGTIDAIGRHAGVHPLALEDVVTLGQRPKVDDYDDDCLFIVLDQIRFDPTAMLVETEQISLVVQQDLLVSFRATAGDIFEPVRVRLRGGRGRIRTGGTDYLAYALIDAVVDHYFPVLDAIGDQIAALEEGIDESPCQEDRIALHRARRNLILLRRSVWPLREVVTRLQHSESPLIDDGTAVFLRDVADHLALIADMIEAYREMVAGLMDLYLSAISNRMNEVMKVLTIIATIFIPLSFIAGVYGMNFDPAAGPLSMPELGWAWGYPAVLALMAVVAGGLLVFFKTRSWL
jgi:magnesium transporter